MARRFVDNAHAAGACVALLLVACSSDDVKAPSTDAGVTSPEASTHVDGATDAGKAVTPAPEGEPFATLGEWHLFADAKAEEPTGGVVPYEVISQLFADYATKYRFMYVPPGAHVGYSDTDVWEFPVGTILVKTFSYLTDARDPSKGERLLETRLLILESTGWAPHTYVWNAAQTQATLKVGGDVIDSTFVTAEGDSVTNGYLVPSENDCRTCHGRLGHTETLGGRTRQLDRTHDYGSGPENQIDHLASLGWFATTPTKADERVHLVDPFGTASVTDRVRAYFDGNCAQCHKAGDAPGSASGLWLDYDSTDPAKASKATWGFCKQPSAAGGGTCGHQFDIVPGAPDDSIMVCRVESSLPKERMPPVGRNLVHAEGAALVREWIEGMGGRCGPPSGDAGANPIRDAGGRDAAPNDAASSRD